jgi:hypothetical protein
MTRCLICSRRLVLSIPSGDEASFLCAHAPAMPASTKRKRIVRVHHFGTSQSSSPWTRIRRSVVTLTCKALLVLLGSGLAGELGMICGVSGLHSAESFSERNENGFSPITPFTIPNVFGCNIYPYSRTTNVYSGSHPGDKRQLVDCRSTRQGHGQVSEIPIWRLPRIQLEVRPVGQWGRF